MKNAIKQRLFTGIMLAVTVMATVKDSMYAYNVLSFVIPVVFIITMLALLSESVRKKSIEATKAKSGASTIGNGEFCAWNLLIALLLAAFGHWFLALLWFISWGVFHGIRLDAAKEKSEKKEEV